MSTTGKNADERRRSSAVHVRAIMNHALDAVAALDAEGAVRFWSPQADRTFGVPRREAMGRELASLVLEEADAGRLRALVREMNAASGDTASRNVELMARRRDGSTFPVELTVTTIPDDDEYRFSAFARDITERRRAETERERLLVAAEQARAQAEAASRVKDEFLATLSHELRTPLTAIVGWIYLLRGGKLDEANRLRALDALDRNAATQAQVISDILDLSRIVGARFRLNVRPIQLEPVVAAAIDTLMPAANARGVKVQTLLDPSAGAVSGDTDRLRQVVWNLLSNAIKFTPKGGRVTVRVQRADANVAVSVEDSGAGITPEFLPHVFERFLQADSSNTRRHGGLGLGLAVVRHLVELHGGQVMATSAGEGQGSTFTVTLPLLEGAGSAIPEAPPALAQEALPGDAPSLHGVRVLVVDPSEEVRDVMTRILVLAGADVEVVDGVAAALASISHSPPQVLVSAIEMDGETGYSLIRKVRSLPPDMGGRVPAAAMTGYSRTQDRVDALLAGFQMHMAKPLQPAELLAVVANLSGRTGTP